MVEDYIWQLRSPDPSVRRAAIIALGKARDPQALPALAQVYLNDPDAALRELAAKAGRYIQRQTQEAGARAEPQGVTWPEWAADGVAASRRDASPPAATSQPAAIRLSSPSEAGFERPPQFVSATRQQIARGHLNRAYDYRLRGDMSSARVALARAVQTDPGLASDESTRQLAADLMALPPKEALGVLLRKAEAGQLQPTRRNPVELITLSVVRRLTVLTVELPLLFLVLLFFVIVFSYRLRTSAAADDFSFILPRLLESLSGPALGRALLVAFGTLAAVIFFLFVVYLLSMFSGGTGTLLRFMTIMLAVQIVVFLVISIGFLFIPFAEFVPAGEPGRYWARIHLAGFGMGLLWAVLFEGYFAARAHRMNIFQGSALVFVGGVLAIILGNALGLFKGSIFG